MEQPKPTLISLTRRESDIDAGHASRKTNKVTVYFTAEFDMELEGPTAAYRNNILFESLVASGSATPIDIDPMDVTITHESGFKYYISVNAP